MTVGAAIVVWRRSEIGLEFLVLHRSHFGPEFAGDWAWGHPGGACGQDETTERCARRELLEETGIDAECVPTDCAPDGGEDFVTFQCEVPADTEVMLSGEHDGYRWLPLADVRELCRPPLVGDQIACVAALLGEQ